MDNSSCDGDLKVWKMLARLTSSVLSYTLYFTMTNKARTRPNRFHTEYSMKKCDGRQRNILLNYYPHLEIKKQKQ